MSKITVTEELIAKLNTAVCRNWVSSAALIYKFVEEHTKASIEDAFVARTNSETGIKFKVTKSSNNYTAAAKLAVMEKNADGTYSVSNAQASRYSTVCQYLKKNKVLVGDVETALEGKLISDIVAGKSSASKARDKTAFEQAVNKGLFVVEQRFEKQVGTDTINLRKLDFTGKISLAAIVCDDEGKVIGIVKATSNNKYNDLARELVAGEAPKETDAETKALDKAIAA